MKARSKFTRYKLILVPATIISLAACSSSGSSGPATSSSTTAAAASTGGLPAPEKPSIRLGILQATTAHDFEVAIENNIFSKYGLNVSYQSFSSQGAEVTALLAGSIDAAVGIGVSEDIASQSTSSPLEAVMTEKDNLSDNFYSGKNITTAAQLKGKAIAISSFGSVTYGEALLALKQLGLSASDVTITQVGNDAARRAALEAGSVGASLDDQSEAPALTAEGMHILVPLAKTSSTGLPVSDVVVKASYASSAPNTVLAVVASLIEATHIFLTTPSEAISAAVKFEKVDTATATANVRYDLSGWRPASGQPSLADFQAAKQLAVKTAPQVASIDVSKAFTSKFTDELKSLGWYTKMGIEAS